MAQVPEMRITQAIDLFKKIESLFESKDYSFFEVALECGDLNTMDALFFVKYERETDGYYKGKVTVIDYELFGRVPSSHFVSDQYVDLKQLVSESLVDDLLTEVLN